MSNTEYFTIVFEGDIRQIKGNPHKVESAFGKVVASGMGNAFDVIENMHEVNDAAEKLVKVINERLDRGHQ